MNKLIFLAAIAAAVPARAGSALECLKGAESCLGESSTSAPAVAAGRTAGPALAALSLEPVKKPARRVPTPAGWRDDEDGTLTTGFFKGLDSGFKAGFAAIELVPVAGMEAFGTPYRENAGTLGFMALGVILSIPAAIVGAVAAPFGAVAGMIAEKVSPGSTKDWFTF